MRRRGRGASNMPRRSSWHRPRLYGSSPGPSLNLCGRIGSLRRGAYPAPSPARNNGGYYGATMDAFFDRLYALHSMLRKGDLPADLRPEYDFCCKTLTHIMLAAQQIAPSPGTTTRASLRMAKVLRTELVFPDGRRERTTTLDLGQAGLAATVTSEVPLGTKVSFSIDLPLGAIAGTGDVVGCRPQGRGHRIALSFEA